MSKKGTVPIDEKTLVATTGTFEEFAVKYREKFGSRFQVDSKLQSRIYNLWYSRDRHKKDLAGLGIIIETPQQPDDGKHTLLIPRTIRQKVLHGEIVHTSDAVPDLAEIFARQSHMVARVQQLQQEQVKLANEQMELIGEQMEFLKGLITPKQA